MDIRQPIHSDHARTLDTEGLRRHFLVDSLFQPEQATLTYSQIDRIIVGGIHPVKQTVRFSAELGKHTGTAFFLERRELGLINIGGGAMVEADGQRYEVGPREALLTSALSIGESNWLGEGDLADACATGVRALARVRSTRAPVPGRMALIDGVPGFVFDTPEEGVAPGQACVLYAAPDGRSVLGGGFIASTVSAA